MLNFPTLDDFCSKCSINYIQALRQHRRLIMWSAQGCLTITKVDCFFFVLYFLLKTSFRKWIYQWSCLKTSQTTQEAGKPPKFINSHHYGYPLTHRHKNKSLIISVLMRSYMMYFETTNNQCYAKPPAK